MGGRSNYAQPTYIGVAYPSQRAVEQLGRTPYSIQIFLAGGAVVGAARLGARDVLLPAPPIDLAPLAFGAAAPGAGTDDDVPAWLAAVPRGSLSTPSSPLVPWALVESDV